MHRERHSGHPWRWIECSAGIGPHGAAAVVRVVRRVLRSLAIPMALGLTLGIILAISGGGNTTTIQQSALGSCVSAAASASGAAPAASGGQRPPPRAPAVRPQRPARARRPRGQRERPGPRGQRERPGELGRAGPCPSASGAPAATAPPSRAFPPSTPRAVPARRANAVDAAGNPFSFSQTPAQALASMNCTVSVPANPLTAQGLATPWQPRGRLHLGERGHRGRIHRRHDPGAEWPAHGLQPAGDQPGHHAGRGADGTDDRGGFAGHPQRRVQRQRAGGGGAGRDAGELHRRLRELADRPDAAVQRGDFYRMANPRSPAAS